VEENKKAIIPEVLVRQPCHSRKSLCHRRWQVRNYVRQVGEEGQHAVLSDCMRAAQVQPCLQGGNARGGSDCVRSRAGAVLGAPLQGLFKRAAEAGNE
jgi:hypothetical protein